jgi:flagellin
MSRINSNIPSLVARSNLRKANDDLETRLQRLSTGLRINRGADDPAGLIISQRLGSEISGLGQAIKNSERASAVISTAEGSLNEVSELLNSIKALVVEAANTGAISDEERQANQLQIDSAIDSITRISESASFGGLKLLNGSLDYVLNGVAASAISKTQIFNANLTNRSALQVNVRTVASAQTGRLYVPMDVAGSNGRLASGQRIEVAGPRGVRVIEFLRSATTSAIVAGINNLKDATGVSAAFASGAAQSGGFVLSSDGFGSDEFVSIKRLGDTQPSTTFATYRFNDNARVRTSAPIRQLITSGVLTVGERDIGRDVFALINGQLGTGRGLVVSLPDSTNLGLSLTLTSKAATTQDYGTSFSITGGGALYQLGGDINSSQQLNLALPSISASRLGSSVLKQKDGTTKVQFLESIKSGGSNSLRSGNFQNASDILSSAIDEISVLRGRLGALERNTLDTNVRSIQAAVENLTASQSVIRDADFASETASLTRAQILAQASTSVNQLANQQAQSVLALLQQ